MKLYNYKKYFNNLSIKDLLNHIIFYMFFGLAISLFNYSFICKLITWFFDFLLLSSILVLIVSPKFIIEETKNKYKQQNPLRNGINEFISLLFVSFLTYNKSWVTLSLFIISIVLVTIIFSYSKLNKNKD